MERLVQGGEHRGHRGPDGHRPREPSLKEAASRPGATRAFTPLARVVGLALALALGPQCQGNANVSFEIELPDAVASQAQWMEIGVLPGACPSPTELAGGIPPTGSVVRVAFQKGDAQPPAIGDLKKASYAFAAAARAADCSVLATGCSEVDVTNARDVTIALSATTTPAGACAAGETCGAGQCAPSTDPDDPGVGAGCSMQLLGAGPFAVPLDDNGDTASAPAVAVTETGFLVAYREYDPGQGVARLTVGAIDEGGALTLPTQMMLPGQCAGQDESDALGLGYLGGSGVVVSARPSCGQGASAGLDAAQVDASGNVQKLTFDPTADSLGLSDAHAIALTGASTGWLAYLDDSASVVIGLSGLVTQGSPVTFGGARPQTLSEVAATDEMIALLAGNGTTLTLQLGAALPGGDGGAPFMLSGTWGAVAAQGSRAYVVSDGGSSAQPLSFSAFDLGGTAPAASTTFAAPGQGAVAGGDVAFQGDRVMFAAEQPGALSIVVYDHASTTPTFLDSVLLSSDPRIPAQDTVRDGRIAIAASDSRVLVAWITATDLGPDDPVGGYALYACAP
ncbi:MAG: hypothetical protein ABSE49_24970 [Polyangiaceae bacterium]